MDGLAALVIGGLVALFGGLRWWQVRQRTAPFADTVEDPVLGRLNWQGYGDGAYWRADVQLDGRTVALLLEGNRAPFPELIAEARRIAAMLPAVQAQLAQFLAAEAARRPAEADTIRSLTLAEIGCFAGTIADDPTGHSGTFLVLTPERASGPEWRCDFEHDRCANLAEWD